MDPNEIEYRVFSAIWEDRKRIPKEHHYNMYAKALNRTLSSVSRKTSTVLNPGKIMNVFSIPTSDEITAKYGTFENAVNSFFKTYYSVHDYKEIPDYLLGAVTGHAKVVQNNRNQMYLRFTSSDQEQIEIIRSFMRQSSAYLSKKGALTIYLRCYDDDLMLALQHAWTTQPFRPTLDFVRGYIDTHSHFRATTNRRKRLTLYGPLVPECHDFLVDLGAKDTRVHFQNGHYRMNIHSKSIRNIRDKLYPSLNCVHNESVRIQMFQE